MVRTPSFLIIHCSHLVALDIERLGNPGWNWANFQKYVARTEGCAALFDTLVRACSRTTSFVEPSAETKEQYNLRDEVLQPLGRNGTVMRFTFRNPDNS